MSTSEAERDFLSSLSYLKRRLTSFIRHDDDDRFRPVSLRIEHAQGHQVLRVRLQPRQSVLLQGQKKTTTHGLNGIPYSEHLSIGPKPERTKKRLDASDK